MSAQIIQPELYLGHVAQVYYFPHNFQIYHYLINYVKGVLDLIFPLFFETSKISELQKIKMNETIYACTVQLINFIIKLCNDHYNPNKLYCMAISCMVVSMKLIGAYDYFREKIMVDGPTPYQPDRPVVYMGIYRYLTIFFLVTCDVQQLIEMETDILKRTDYKGCEMAQILHNYQPSYSLIPRKIDRANNGPPYYVTVRNTIKGMPYEIYFSTGSEEHPEIITEKDTFEEIKRQIRTIYNINYDFTLENMNNSHQALGPITEDTNLKLLVGAISIKSFTLPNAPTNIGDIEHKTE